jgi:hypothetical protein
MDVARSGTRRTTVQEGREVRAVNAVIRAVDAAISAEVSRGGLEIMGTAIIVF